MKQVAMLTFDVITRTAQAKEVTVDSLTKFLDTCTPLPEDQRRAFASQLGIPPEQLEQVMQVMQSMPPDQLAQMMSGAGAGGGGGPPPGTIQLTQEEMDAVQRLQALGFSQQQAAQAFLACDRNEMLAANMLMDGGFAEEDEAGEGGGF